MFEKLQQYAKAIVSLVGAVLTAGAFTLPDEAQPWVGLALAVLTAIATYAVPNGGPAGDTADAMGEASADVLPTVEADDVLTPGDGLGAPPAK